VEVTLQKSVIQSLVMREALTESNSALEFDFETYT